MVLLEENFLFLAKSNKKLLSVGCFLFISELYESKLFGIVTLVILQYQSSQIFLFVFLFHR